MIFIPILSLVVGVLLGLLLKAPIRGELGIYVGVVCLAGLDTICGGIRSQLEGKFDNSILITGFVANIMIAFLLSWLGDRINVDLVLVCALIFGQRIFVNLSVIRRILLTKWTDNRTRREQEKALEAQQSQQAQQT